MEQGLDPELLASYVLSQRMSRERLADDTKAVDAAINAVFYWSAAGDPLAFLAGDRFNVNLQTYLDEGAFDAALEKYLAHPVATGLAICTGEPGLKER